MVVAEDMVLSVIIVNIGSLLNELLGESLV